MNRLPAEARPLPLSMDSLMLINCVVYENGHKRADIAIAEISDWLHRPQCFVWVALQDPDAQELAQMQAEFGLHELAVEDARKGHQRPKIEEYGDTVFVVMHLLDPTSSAGAANALSAASEEEQLGELAVFAGPHFVLSVRSRNPHGFLSVRERCEREPELLQNGAGFVLYALMDAVVDRYFPVLDGFESELDRVEEQIFTPGAARGNIEQLYALKNRTSVLRHAASPLVDVLGKLHGGRVPTVCAGVQEYFRDVHDHVTRISSATDAVRDTIGTAIQVNLSMVTIEESETTKRLAAWAAIFAASTALAGIWGMNFKGMPELQWDYGYPIALSVIFTTGMVLYWRFRKAGWL